MNTLENNKLIAEFMEVPTMSNDNGTVYCPIDEYTGETLFLVNTIDFKYNTSWDWLMPVVEKIEGIGASVIIGRFFCEIKYIDALNQEKQFEVRIASGIKINAVTSAVVNFIKWYNENQ